MTTKTMSMTLAALTALLALAAGAQAGTPVLLHDSPSLHIQPETMRVRVDQVVDLDVSVPNGQNLAHDLYFPDFDAHTSVLQPGQGENLRFTADKAGTFEYYCTVPGHREGGMRGTITVVGDETSAKDDASPQGDNETPAASLAFVTLGILGAALIRARRAR